MKQRGERMKWLFIGLGAVFAVAIGGGFAALCRKRPEKSNDDIDGGVVYTLEGEGDTTQLRRYRETYRGGEDELMLESSVPCGVQTMIELMNTCGILRWDGFYGKHPRGVKDGTMFTFTATVNGGQTIRAEGSTNFPKGYHEFVPALNEMLANTEIT